MIVRRCVTGSYVVAALAACSSTRTSAPAPNVVNGSEDEVSLTTIADAQGFVGTGQAGAIAGIVLTDTPRYCALVKSKPANECGWLPASSTILWAIIVVPGATTVPPGTYTHNTLKPGHLDSGIQGTTATAGFAQFDGACNSLIAGRNPPPTSGTIAITTSSSAGVKGTFDLTFPGGHITGSFDVPVCDAFDQVAAPGCTMNTSAYCG